MRPAEVAPPKAPLAVTQEQKLGDAVVMRKEQRCARRRPLAPDPARTAKFRANYDYECAAASAYRVAVGLQATSASINYLSALFYRLTILLPSYAHCFLRCLDYA